MSETKWTAGPWRVDHECWSQVTGDCYVIEGEREAERKHNACLIAAAPDLYEALVAIDDNWGIGGFTGPEDPRAQDRFTDRTIAAWRKIRAALAKARGEA